MLEPQLNGAGGVNVNGIFEDANRSDEEILLDFEAMALACRKTGCTTWFPTMITCPTPKIKRFLEFYKRNEIKMKKMGARGVHIEGNVISIAKKGIHNMSYRREEKGQQMEFFSMFDSYVDMCPIIITVAPEEVLVNDDIITKLRDKGIIFSMGHTNADRQAAEKAIDTW